MNRQGRRQERLTYNKRLDVEPSFAPDSNTIIFSRKAGGNYDLWTMRANGTQTRRLTNTPSHEFDPDFSPDGRRIAFVFVSNTERDGEIATIDAVGGNMTLLTANADYERDPAFSPDGSMVSFSTLPAPGTGVYNLAVASATGGVATTITRDSLRSDSSPSWQPR